MHPKSYRFSNSALVAISIGRRVGPVLLRTVIISRRRLSARATIYMYTRALAHKEAVQNKCEHWQKAGALGAPQGHIAKKHWLGVVLVRPPAHKAEGHNGDKHWLAVGCRWGTASRHDETDRAWHRRRHKSSPRSLRDSLLCTQGHFF